jgi:hypothetical protein
MEADWIPRWQACWKSTGATFRSIIWEAHFLYGLPTGASEDSYVRCEINVSSVFPIPHSGTGRNRP